MTKKAYIHAFKTIECLLGKQKEFTIKDLAVQFGCMEASDLAQQIHQRCIIIPSPLHPIISLYTPHTVFSTFLMVLSSIISLTIESLLNLWSFLLFSWPECYFPLFYPWYCKLSPVRGKCLSFGDKVVKGSDLFSEVIMFYTKC